MAKRPDYLKPKTASAVVALRLRPDDEKRISELEQMLQLKPAEILRAALESYYERIIKR